MLELYKETLPAPEDVLRTSLKSYQAALAAHADTEGVPAPWPEFDILRDIVAAGGDFIVKLPPVIESPPTVTKTANDLVKEELAGNDLRIIRALTEGDTLRIESHKKMQADLRAKLTRV